MVTSTAERRPRATYQDVLDAPENRVAEIVDGTLYTHPRPAMRHARAGSSLGVKLGGPFDYDAGGPGGCGSSTSPNSTSARASCCRTWRGWHRERMPDYPDAAYVTLAPDWVCEVLSALDAQARPAGEATGLRPRRRRASVAGRTDGPHPQGVQAARRAVAAVREREEQQPGQHPPVRCDHLQSR